MNTTPEFAVVIPEGVGGAIRSEVRVNGTVMRYRRLGTGKGLLVLAGREGQVRRHEARGAELEPIGHPVLQQMLARAARCRRVLIPEVPFAADSLTVSWLREFMDGLGLTRVAMVVDETFGVVALELAMIDHDRIASLVVFSPGEDDNGALAGSLTGPFPETQVRLLIVRAAEATAESTADEVMAFLDAESTRGGH